MPLSEHEQRILADIEARLREDDPRFVDAVATDTEVSQARGRLKWIAAALVVGFILLIVGVAVHWIWGLVGFGVMLAAAYQGLSLAKRLAMTQTGPGGARAGGPLQRYLDGARRNDDER